MRERSLHAGGACENITLKTLVEAGAPHRSHSQGFTQMALYYTLRLTHTNPYSKFHAQCVQLYIHTFTPCGVVDVGPVCEARTGSRAPALVTRQDFQ